MNEIPKRKNMTKKMRTKMINANLATILFEFKNSFEPSKDTFVAGIAGIYDDNEFVVVGVFVLLK